MTLPVVKEASTVAMIIRTPKLRRGDVITEPVSGNADHPYREVMVTRSPEVAEILYDGRWHEVRYVTGTDCRNGQAVAYTGTEFTHWQITRPTGR